MSMCKVDCMTQASRVAQTLEQQAAVILEMPSSGCWRAVSSRRDQETGASQAAIRRMRAAACIAQVAFF